MDAGNLKSIVPKTPASSPEVIKLFQDLLERAYEHPVKTVSVSMLIDYGNAMVHTNFDI